jgi:hypothetical protein
MQTARQAPREVAKCLPLLRGGETSRRRRPCARLDDRSREVLEGVVGRARSRACVQTADPRRCEDRCKRAMPRIRLRSTSLLTRTAPIRSSNACEIVVLPLPEARR